MNKPGSACYSPGFLLFSVACAAVVMGAAWIAKGYPHGSAARIALAFVQGGATTAVIISSMLRLRRLDEMQKRIQLEALALAFTGTAVLSTAYGFLVNAGLPDIEWGTLTWPVMVGLWAVGMVIASRRYR